MSTDHAVYRFTVKEGQASPSGADNAPISLMLESMEGELPALSDGFLSLHLKPGTTMAEAHELERQLNRIVVKVSHTHLR